MASALEEIRNVGVVRAALALGLQGDLRSGLGPCPACFAPTRHPSRHDKRGAIGVRADGMGWACWECNERGDAVDLVRWRAVGVELERGDPRWADVVAAGASAGLCAAADGTPRKPLPPILVATSRPPPPRPPRDQLEAMWSACGSVADDAQVAAFLRGRGLDPAELARLDECRALPARHPWPTWWPETWAASWRLVLPAYDAAGALVSMHARAVLLDAQPKTRWPKDCGAAGLLFADYAGMKLLQAQLAPAVEGVVIVEGATDTLAAILWARRTGRALAVLGITSGSAVALKAVRWPKSGAFFIATDNDAAGEHYAAQVVANLPAGADVRRVHF